MEAELKGYILIKRCSNKSWKELWAATKLNRKWAE
jgi:hypothetical protein